MCRQEVYKISLVYVQKVDQAGAAPSSGEPEHSRFAMWEIRINVAMLPDMATTWWRPGDHPVEHLLKILGIHVKIMERRDCAKEHDENADNSKAHMFSEAHPVRSMLLT